MELTDILEGFKTFYELRKDKLYLSDCLNESELIQFQNLPNDLSAIPAPYQTIIICSNQDLIKKIELFELKIANKIKQERTEKFLELLNNNEKSEDLIQLLNKIGTVKITIDDGKISIVNNKTITSDTDKTERVTLPETMTERLKYFNYDINNYKHFKLIGKISNVEFNIPVQVENNNFMYNGKLYTKLGGIYKDFMLEKYKIDTQKAKEFSLNSWKNLYGVKLDGTEVHLKVTN